MIFGDKKASVSDNAGGRGLASSVPNVTYSSQIFVTDISFLWSGDEVPSVVCVVLDRIPSQNN